jgi:hypothetical protein
MLRTNCVNVLVELARSAQESATKLGATDIPPIEPVGAIATGMEERDCAAHILDVRNTALANARATGGVRQAKKLEPFTYSPSYVVEAWLIYTAVIGVCVTLAATVLYWFKKG